jgi:peptide subunit release factor 1 (eRF1)
LGLEGKSSGAFGLLVALAVAVPAAEDWLHGQELEAFLQKARVLETKTIPVGVSQPRQATLSDGDRTIRAVWKTINEFRPLQRFEDGTVEIGFRDSFKHEIAAYELDKLLKLGLVPPTVERRYERERGSMQLWMEDCITEAERIERGLKAPDMSEWNRMMFNVRLFRQLTYDTDFNNVRNLLVDEDFRLYAVDFSRAFRNHGALRAEGDLTKFSALLLKRLESLNEPLLREKLGRWLTKAQIRALLERRDRILTVAAQRIAKYGEEAVLLP